MTALCDLNIERLKEFCDKFPTAFGTTDVSKVLTRDAVDAVVIATPTKTHFELAAEALSQGIHTFVEKPLATSSAECQTLIEMAEAQQLKLFVGHIFLHSAPVAKLKEMVLNDDFGDIYYMSSTRLNLGPVRHDVSALWDLAPHDISIMLDLMGSAPVSVNCSGLAYLNEVDSRRLHIQYAIRKQPDGNCARQLVGPAQETRNDCRRQQENGDLQRPGTPGKDQGLRQRRRIPERYSDSTGRNV